MKIKNRKTPDPAPPARDWDPEAAFARLADGDVEGLTARLHQAAEVYARSPAGHLSFEEMQRVVAADPVQLERHAGHLEICEYCAGLRETLTNPEADRRAFAEVVGVYERPAVDPGLETGRTEPVRRPRRTRWRWLEPLADLLPTLPAWTRPVAAAAGIVVLVAAIPGAYVGGLAHQRHTDESVLLASRLEEPAPRLAALIGEPKPDWDRIREDCTRQSGEKESCGYFAEAARLEIAHDPDKTDAIAPIVVAGLRSSGVSPAVIEHVQSALDTRPAEDAVARVRGYLALKAALASRNKDADAHLKVARLRFETGSPVQGYESLVYYVSADNAAAGKALTAGFVEPVQLAALIRSKGRDRALGSVPTSLSTDMDASAAAVAAADSSASPGTPSTR